MRRLWLDRTGITILLTAVLTVAVGALRSGTVMGRHLPDAFWAQKLLWGPQFDMVVAGDSRVYRGVSPAAMEAVLPGTRIANYAFSACAYKEPYLQTVDTLLDARSSRPTILLGVTASSFSPMSVKQNGFDDLWKRHRFELLQLTSLGRLSFFFSPYDWEEVMNLFRKQKTGYTVVWHSDGWVQSRKTPEDPMEAVRVYTRNAKKDRQQLTVSPELVDTLLQSVRDWRRRGILVYGFRPPTTPEMVEFETTWMGFDEPAFVRRFEEAGGVWLPFPVSRYHSYDGSHLRDDAALQFSRDLAESLHRSTLAGSQSRVNGPPVAMASSDTDRYK